MTWTCRCVLSNRTSMNLRPSIQRNQTLSSISMVEMARVTFMTLWKRSAPHGQTKEKLQKQRKNRFYCVIEIWSLSSHTTIFFVDVKEILYFCYQWFLFSLFYLLIGDGRLCRFSKSRYRSIQLSEGDSERPIKDNFIRSDAK